MRQMKTYWIVAGLTTLAAIISVFGIFNGFINFFIDNNLPTGQEVELTPEQTLELFSIIGGWLLFAFVAGMVQLVFAILQLVNYAGGAFPNSSKVGMALYQYFFGLNLVGLIIVLVVQPKAPEPLVKRSSDF